MLLMGTENKTVKPLKNGKQINKKGLFRFLSVLLWVFIGILFVFGGIELIDKSTGYNFLPTHTAVIVSDSMSFVNDSNLDYLDPNCEHYYKGDIIKAKDYKSFDEIKELDVVLYVSSDGNLVCHRVVNKFEDESGKWIVTRGDANSSNDTAISYDIVRGKVTNRVKGIGYVAIVMQSPYFLLAVCGSGFSIFLGMLIAGISEDKKKAKQVEEKVKKPVPPKDEKGRFIKTTIKSVFIPLLLFGTLSSFLSTASALAINKNDDLKFTISSVSPVNYYLCNNRTSWADSDDYKFSDVTSTMTAETNKIHEYVLTGKYFAKNDTMKVHDSEGNWLNSTFTHNWSGTSVVMDNTNYKVLMTSNSYSFTLKIFNDGTSTVSVTEDKDVLFFKPSSDWRSSSARFACYMWNDDENTWKNFVATSETYVFSVDITGYSKVIICRMDPSKSENKWENKWNQSGDINISNYDPNNMIENTAWNDWTASSNSSWSSR